MISLHVDENKFQKEERNDVPDPRPPIWISGEVYRVSVVSRRVGSRVVHPLVSVLYVFGRSFVGGIVITSPMRGVGGLGDSVELVSL